MAISVKLVPENMIDYICFSNNVYINRNYIQVGIKLQEDAFGSIIRAIRCTEYYSMFQVPPGEVTN